MTWKLLVGASILSVGLLLKIGAPIVPIALGVTMAVLLQWRRQRRRERTPRGSR